MPNRTMELVSLVIVNRADEAITILDGDFGASAYEELIPTLERRAGKSRK